MGIKHREVEGVSLNCRGLALAWRPGMNIAFVCLMEIKNREVINVVVVLLVLAKVVVGYRAVELLVTKIVGKYREAM